MNIRFSGEHEERVAAAAGAAAAFLQTAIERDAAAVDILGPAPAPLSMIRNRFRWQLLLKSKDPPLLHLLCNQLINEKSLYYSTGIRMGIDVDPENMM